MTPGHEPNRVASGVLLRIAGIMVACLLAVLAGVYGLVRLGADTTAEHPAQPIPPAPRLQADPPPDRLRVLAMQRAALERYQWIDRRRGIARIPVERAMVLVAKGVRAGRPETGPAVPATTSSTTGEAQ